MLFYSAQYLCIQDLLYFLCRRYKKKNLYKAKLPQQMIMAKRRREAQRRERLSLCRQCYEFVPQHHGVLKCHVQRWSSWYAEKGARQRRSRLDACQETDAVNHKTWSCLCLITKGLCASSSCGLFLDVFFNIFFLLLFQHDFLHCSPEPCWSFWCMGNQWCCTESIWVYLWAMIHISSPRLSPAPLL